MRCKWFLFLFCFQGLIGSEFVLFTEPKTGIHLMIPLLEVLSGKEGIWPREFISPSLDCDQETYEDLFDHPKYVAHLWHKKPVKAKNFRHALHKARWNGEFIYCNTPYSKNMEELLEAKNIKVFTILRDPRDTIVSAWQHYLRFGDGVIEEDWVSDLPIDEQLKCFIIGTRWHNSARRLFTIFSGWQKSNLSCTVNFTKLLGIYGRKANEEEQLGELRKIARHLGVKKTDKELLRAFDRAYGIGYTFQKSRVGAWKNVFSSEIEELVEQELGDLLMEYGFE